MSGENLEAARGAAGAEGMRGREGEASTGMVFGVFLLALGGVGLMWGLRMEVPGFVAPGDPGPRALPLAMSAVLLVGGLQQVLAGVLRARKRPSMDAYADGLEKAEKVRETKWNWLRWGGTAAGIMGFALLLPWTGFVVAAGLFVTGYLRASGMAWWKGLVAAAVLAAAVVVLFGTLFRVQLPAGRLGLPF